jgi:hypothetical protein
MKLQGRVFSEGAEISGLPALLLAILTVRLRRKQVRRRAVE